MNTHLHRSTQPTLSLLPSPQFDVVEQHVDNDGHLSHHQGTLGHAASDEESTRSILETFLAFLNRYDEDDGRNNTYRDIIRICIEKMLAGCQSEATKVEERTWDSTVDLQAIFASQCPQRQLSDQTYHLSSQESANPDVLLFNASTSSSVKYELGMTQSFQSFVPAFPGGQNSAEFSTSHYQQLCPPIVEGGREKMRCTWPGCSSIILKDNYRRHVNETHQGKVVAVCENCGRKFQRGYMKKNHICHGPHRT